MTEVIAVVHDNLPVLELAAPGPDRDSGVATIRAGTKTASTELVLIYEHAAEPLPQPGRRFSVIASAGRPAAIIELGSPYHSDQCS